MNNQHLFALLNAGPGMGFAPRSAATVLAQWVIGLIPVGLAIGWVRGDLAARRELLQILLAVLLALAFAQVVSHLWPQPRPFMLHLGTQYLPHAGDPGLPSDHVTVFWSLALAALTTRRYAVWGLPLLALGLVVGWSRVFLGVHFPLDVLAALPVAWAGAFAAHRLRAPLAPVFARILCCHDRLVAHARTRFERGRNA